MKRFATCWTFVSLLGAPFRAAESIVHLDRESIGESCRDCHREIVESYRLHGMARALGAASGDALEGLSPVDDPATGWRYTFERDGPRAKLIEDWRDAQGEVFAPARTSTALVFAVGAGIHDRSFVAERGSLLWFAPLEVLTVGGKHVAQLSPGAMSTPGLRFELPIQEECFACHTDALPPAAEPSNAAPPSDWTPRGIACETCHASAAEHITWRRAELEGVKHDGADPLAARDPADPLESVSSCARCHLQGDARVVLEADPRRAFAARGDFLERVAVFTGGPTDEIGFVSQVERLVQSRCFTASLASAHPLTCTTCHDPHVTIADRKERSRVRSACRLCHSGEAQRRPECALPLERRASRECVECHLRTTPVFDLSGVAMLDHRITRTAVAPSKFASVRAKQSASGPLVRFRWPSRTPPLDGDPGVEMLARVAAGRPDEAATWIDRQPNDAVAKLSIYHHARGMLLERAAEFERAAQAFARALELEPTSSASSTDLGLALVEAGRPKDGLAVLDRTIAAHPLAQGAFENRALAKLALHEFDGARSDLEAAQRILPRAAIARGLAELARRAGDAAAAASWTEVARNLDPTRD